MTIETDDVTISDERAIPSITKRTKTGGIIATVVLVAFSVFLVSAVSTPSDKENIKQGKHMYSTGIVKDAPKTVVEVIPEIEPDKKVANQIVALNSPIKTDVPIVYDAAPVVNPNDNKEFNHYEDERMERRNRRNYQTNEEQERKRLERFQRLTAPAVLYGNTQEQLPNSNSHVSDMDYPDVGANPYADGLKDIRNQIFSSLQPNIDTRDANTRFAEQVAKKEVEIAQARKLGNLEYRIMQGKLITAVLESAIDSSLPGVVRANVDRNVYGESGRRILIRRGSRLIGEYNSAVRNGQNRIFIIWTRLIQPEGIDIDLDSPGTDPLGRAGAGGTVETHFFKRFGNSILLSLLGAGTSTINPGDLNKTSSLYRQVIADSFHQSASKNLEENINIPPTIGKDQGDRITVFVSKDLDFEHALSLVGR